MGKHEMTPTQLATTPLPEPAKALGLTSAT